jgi:hypothetical protein
MAEAGGDRADLLRQEYGRQTARIGWRDLQTHFAAGSVIVVAPELDLVEVAVQLGMDNAALLRRWMEAGDVAGVSDEQALAWYESGAGVQAVVAAPWVLVQQRDG